MNIDNMTARELMEILNDLWEDFDTVSKPMLLGALCTHFHTVDRATQSLQEATTEPQTAQSNNSTTDSINRHDKPIRTVGQHRAITVNGITYESIKTACLRLGVKYSTVTQATYRHHTAPEKVIEFLLNKRSMNE